MSFIGTAVIGSAVLGAGASIYGANKAASAQTSAAQTAANTNLSMYNTTRGDLAPYRNIGNQAASDMSTRLSDLTSPISVNPQDFLNSDQYKFQQTQGERAVTNSSAARGLGTSGAALKGAAAFESGLNAQQWQQNFNNQNTNQSNAYNRLAGLIQTGENAGAQTGSAGTAAASQAGSAQTQAGTAQAASANLTGSALSNLANNISGYAQAKGLYGGSANNLNTTGMAGNSSSPYYAPLNG